MEKAINKPKRKKEEIIKFMDGLNQGMINEDEKPEHFDLTRIKKILVRPKNNADLSSEE